MDRLQVSMAKAHKQEETLRESRYFTALKHYKHPERGRKTLLIQVILIELSEGGLHTRRAAVAAGVACFSRRKGHLRTAAVSQLQLF